MAVRVTARSEVIVGQPTIVEGPAPEGTFSAVFEDDRDTGYFYALDTSTGGNAIKEALHVYTVTSMTGALSPSIVEIGWSSDSSKCVLLIDGHPHAVFDFETKRGYCRADQAHDCEDAVDRLFTTDLH
jgi:hypothetical protein